MEKQKIRILYSDKHDALVYEINTLKHKSRGFILGEVLTFLLFIGFLVLFTITDFGLVFIAMALISILAYVGIRYADVKNNAKIDIKESLDLYAKEHGVSIISSKLNNPDHSSIFEKLGIGFINPERSVVRFITRMIIRPSAQSLVTLGKGGAEILEFTVQNEELDGKKISEIENDSPYFKIVSKFVNDEDDAIQKLSLKLMIL